jgi:hypothetical protein
VEKCPADREYSQLVEWLEVRQQSFSEYYDDLAPDPTVASEFGAAQFRERWNDYWSLVYPGIALKDLLGVARHELAFAESLALTKFERPWQLSIIHKFSTQIRAALVKLGFTEDIKILFGTLPTCQFNGTAVALPGNSRRLVLLDTGVFGFSNLASKCLAGSLRLEWNGTQMQIDLDSDYATSKIMHDNELQTRFRDLLFSYLVKGDPHQAKPYLPPPDQVLVAGKLRDSMQLFLIAHEIAHCVLGHLERSASEEGGDVRTLIKMRHDEEFEADALALRIVVYMAQNPESKFWTLAGITMFFGADRCIQNSLILMQADEQSAAAAIETHPSSKERLNRLYDLMQCDYPDLHHAFRFAQTISTLMDSLWFCCDGMFIKMRHDKVKLARAWQAVEV